MRVLFAGAGAALLAAAAPIAMAPVAHADTVNLRYNRWLPPTHHVDVRVLAPFFKAVEAATQGRVKIGFTASSLGGIARQYELAATGIADVTFLSESLTPGKFPLAEIVEMPFLGDNTEAVSVAYWRVYKKYFEAKNPYRETHLLTLGSLPSYHIYNARRSLVRLDDFKGLKIRAAGALANAKVRSLGAVVVPAQITQFAEMISKGIVDGTYFTDDGVRAFGFLKYLKFKTHFPKGLSGYSVAVVMNKRKWMSLSDADRKAIDGLAGERLSRQFGASFDKSVASAQDAMKKAGVTVTTADAALMAEVKKRMAPIEAGWIAKARKLGVDGKAALEMLRREAASYKPAK